MKKVLTLFCLLMAVACKKKDDTNGIYHCTIVTNDKVPAKFVMTGFSTAELDTVLYKTYQPGSNFSTLLSTIVLGLADSKIFPDDSPSRWYFIDTWPGEYEIVVPATGSTYRLSGFHTQDSIQHFDSDRPCNDNTGHAVYNRIIDTILINGKPTPATYHYTTVAFYRLYR